MIGLPGYNWSPQKHWRVFYTQPRAEIICEERLLEQGFHVFVPKMQELRQWSDRKKKVTVPLFRSYLFGHVDERERIRVLQADGVSRNVSFGGRLAILTHEEIEMLRIMQQRPDLLSIARYGVPPAIGAPVEIKDGPFMGLKGTVMQQRAQTHLLVRIDSIQQAVRITLPMMDIRVLAGFPH